MAFMTEWKARRLLKDYMDAELSGDDSKAEEIENKLKEAGWKITVGPEGHTVIRQHGGLFSGDDKTDTDSSNFMFPQENFVAPYQVTQRNRSGSNNIGLIIGISLGAIVLIVAIVLAVKAIKAKKNAVVSA